MLCLLCAKMQGGEGGDCSSLGNKDLESSDKDATRSWAYDIA